MHKELVNSVREASGSPETQIGGYLKVLIERKLPIFAKPEAKRGRYYVSDNFLRAWLGALANPVSAIAFRPLNELIDEADRHLADGEGGALEKLVGQLYEERSRKGIGDFSLTHRVQGYWDKADVEIDFVAVNESEQTIRFGSCKRSPGKLISDVNYFKQHVQRFTQAMPMYQAWKLELVGIAPVLNSDQRAVLVQHDIIPQDLNELTAGLDSSLL
jgi:hypothetical protein